MWLKRKIAPLLHWAALKSGTSVQRMRNVPGARIITFHAVGTPECTTKVFEQTVAFCKKYYDVVSLAVITDNLARQHPDLKKQVALTFDDGLRNNLKYAYPILKKYNAPAAFFICPGLVERGAWLWNVEARARLRWMHPGGLSELADSLGRPGSNHLQIVDWLKKLPIRSRMHVEQVIREATPAWKPNRSQEIANDLMSWDELKILDPKLITIGGHSTNHPILANCNSQELIHEVAECGPLIEKRLLRKVEYFCYPNGDFNPLVTRFVEQNYRAATNTKTGIINAAVKPHEIPRVGSSHSFPHFVWRMHKPTS